MSTVRDLREDVINALDWEPAVNPSTITCSVSDGVVTLSGTVRNHAEKTAAADAVKRLRGVRAIANDLAVRLEAPNAPTDTAIAKAVANALEWDTAVPMNSIKVVVSDGWVTLSGTVEWQFQKSAAQVAAERTYGVQGVKNLIALKPRATTGDVRAKIQEAFERHAGIDARHILVQADGGTVTLTGTVRSLIERDDAERAAWSAPGITAVDNRIAVSPL